MRRRYRSAIGWTVITITGLLLTVFDIAYVLAGQPTDAEVVSAWIGPVALTVAVGVLARRERNPEPEVLPRGDVLAAWFAPGVLLFALAVAMTLLVQAAEGASVHDIEFASVNWGFAGGTVGLLVGWYDLRNRAERRKLERAQATVERRERQRSVLNRVLRHDVRTAMNLVIGYADRLDDSEAAAAIHRHADGVVTIADQARRVERMVGESRREDVDVAAHLADVVTEVRAAYADVEVSYDAPAAATAWVYPEVTGAFDLAFEAAVGDELRALDVTYDVTRVEGDAVVETVIVDDSPVTGDVDRLVLEEGETPLRHASGMGLWTAKWTVEECGGAFDFESREAGNRTTIRLPADRPAERARDGVSAAEKR